MPAIADVMSRSWSAATARGCLLQDVTRGLVCGAIATVAEATWSFAEVRLRAGRRPVFDTTMMAARLLQRVTGTAPQHRVAAVTGSAMRAAYGPAWSLAWTAMPYWRRHSVVRASVALAAVIWLSELALLPWVGATPSLKRWPRADILLDGTNALVFSLVLTAALKRAGLRPLPY
jgi:hypothetical protein